MTESIKAPFTDVQVVQLNLYQKAGWMHPFTCPREHSGSCPSLVAVADQEWGWVCPSPDCNYTQDWAHAFMAQAHSRVNLK